MPVTRSSSSKPSSLRTPLTPSAKRKLIASSSGTGAPLVNHSDVIVLSDGEAHSVGNSKKGSASNSKRTNDRQRGKARAKPLVPIGEVFEISSEDEQPVQPFSVIADLQTQVQKLQKENADLKTVRKLEVEKNKVVLDVSQIEDNISCEICTSKLWRPFILPECGHTFCQSCLEDWFDTILVQHMAVHPNYNPNGQNQHILNGLPAHIRDLLSHHIMTPQFRAHIQQHYPQYQVPAPTPQYTCPTCREQVKTKPVEDFALKGLVRTITAATGESSPKSGSKMPRGRSGVGRRAETWDAFFRGSA